MAQDDVTLTLEGAAEHRGHVMAHALRDKLDRFLKTFGSFERAYLGRRVRQTDFEVTELSRNSAHLGLHPVPRVRNYVPGPVLDWTFDQWEKITHGRAPDSIVTDDLVGDVIELGRRPEDAEFADFKVSYHAININFDDTSQANALALHAQLISARGTLPWVKGLSLGSLTGELRSVLDTHHERQIVISPPLGRAEIRCVFAEDQREKIRDYLFFPVRVTGILHYGADSPLPYLIEIKEIEGLGQDTDRPHLLNGLGLFQDISYPNVTQFP